MSADRKSRRVARTGGASRSPPLTQTLPRLNSLREPQDVVRRLCSRLSDLEDQFRVPCHPLCPNPDVLLEVAAGLVRKARYRQLCRQEVRADLGPQLLHVLVATVPAQACAGLGPMDQFMQQDVVEGV